jgi:CPA1 family monovalent cation:H+ antiporter
MVLALSLPAGFAYRELLIDLTFGVVLVSILVQGLTMAPVLRWAGAVGGGDEKRRYMMTRGALRATRESLRALDEWLSKGEIHQETYDALRNRFTGRLATLEESLAQFDDGLAEGRRDELERTRERLKEVQRGTLRVAESTGIITDDVARALIRDLWTDSEMTRPSEAGDERTPSSSEHGG